MPGFGERGGPLPVLAVSMSVHYLNRADDRAMRVLERLPFTFAACGAVGRSADLTIAAHHVTCVGCLVWLEPASGRAPAVDPDAVSARPARRLLSTTEAAREIGVGRSTLDGMVRRAPADLPGAPVHLGDGRQRRHLGWEGARLHQWVQAFRAWEAAGSPGRRVRGLRPHRTAKREEGEVADWATLARELGCG